MEVLLSAIMGDIDFAAEDWYPVVNLPENYDVLDLTGDADNIRTSEYSIGRYNEIRQFYTTELFSGNRCVHIGIDIGGPVGTPIMSVFSGKVAFSGYNPADGDYGHTIITKHNIQGQNLWILYGHLDAASTEHCPPGKVVEAGDVIAWFGDEHENGGWEPHLHFQLSFREPNTHDLPGVVALSDREQALIEFPDPRLVLGHLY